MLCKSCGNQIDDGLKFCPTCGAPVEAEQQANPETGLGLGSEATTILSSNFQQPQQTGQQTYYQQPQQQNYQGTNFQEPFNNKNKLGGYLLAIVIILFLAAALNGIVCATYIGDYFDIIDYLSTYSHLAGVTSLIVGMILLVIYTILLPLTQLLTPILILARKKVSGIVYLVMKSVCIVLFIIAMVIFVSNDLDLDDIFTSTNIVGIIMNTGFFIANTIYLFKSERAKEFLNK